MDNYIKKIQAEINALEEIIDTFDKIRKELKHLTGKVVNKRIETYLKNVGFNVTLTRYQYKDNTFKVNYWIKNPYQADFYRNYAFEIYVNDDGRYEDGSNIEDILVYLKSRHADMMLEIDPERIKKNDARAIELKKEINAFLDSLKIEETERYQELKRIYYFKNLEV